MFVPIFTFRVVASGLACFISSFLKVETSGRDLVGDVEEETGIERSETSVSVAHKFRRRNSSTIVQVDRCLFIIKANFLVTHFPL